MTGARPHRDRRAPGEAFVVVPYQPGPLVVPEESKARDRDELDELVDDLFPDIDDPPGWFDAGLTAVGVGLLAWSIIGDGPRIAVVAGVVAVGLASVLPVRSAWRWLQSRSRRRRTTARLAAGVALDGSSPAVARLLGSYRSLLDTPGPDTALAERSRAAAHAAVVEVATLLDGRTPTSDGELRYVDERATAIAALLAELEALTGEATAGATPVPEAPAVDPDLLVAAREELDQLSSSGSVTRIEQLAEEARQHRDR